MPLGAKISALADLTALAVWLNATFDAAVQRWTDLFGENTAAIQFTILSEKEKKT